MSQSDAYVIEVHGQTVGIIVRFAPQDEDFRFLSSAQAVNDLEGHRFQGPWQAELAARELLRKIPPQKKKTSAIGR